MEHFVRQMHPTKRLQGCWGSVWPSWLSAMSRAGPGTDGVNFCTCIPVVRAVTDIALDGCVAQAPTSPQQTSKPQSLYAPLVIQENTRPAKQQALKKSHESGDKDGDPMPRLNPLVSRPVWLIRSTSALSHSLPKVD